jgi:hypothetical protein
MKKIYLFIMLIACLITAPAGAGVDEFLGQDTVDEFIGQPVAAAGGSCPSGTYLFAYDGDYPSDTGKACLNSGGSQVDDTQNNSPTVTSDYVTLANNTADQYISWASIGSCPVPGTLWLSAYLDDATSDQDTNIDNTLLVEIYFDSDNYIQLRFEASSSALKCYFKGGGTTDAIAIEGLSVDTEYRVGVSWALAAENPDFCITVDTFDGTNTSGVDQYENDGLGVFDTAPSSLTIGDKDTGYSMVDNARVSDVYLISGWQQSDPDN